MKLVGLLVGTAILVTLTSLYVRQKERRDASEPLVLKMRALKPAWAEYYASNMNLPDTNAMGNNVMGGQPFFGQQTQMGRIDSFNVNPGGVLEVRLKDLDDARQPLRAAFIPRITAEGRLDGFACVSHNWPDVAATFRDCRYDLNARTEESRHVTLLASLSTPAVPTNARRPVEDWQAARRQEDAARFASEQSELDALARLQQSQEELSRAERDLDEVRYKQQQLPSPRN
jgi:hypothetical protein